MRFLLLAVLILPFAAYGENRFAIEPSLEVKEVHDDNLNYSADEPLRDRISRITPTLVLRFDAPRWSLRTTYGLDSERFATHSVLDNDRARERAIVGIQYQVGPRLTLSMDSSYLYTNTLADLNVATGLAASRVRGRQVSIGPSARFRISPRLTAVASASSMTTNVQDGVGMRSQMQTLIVERRLTPRDLFTVDYQHSRILFDGQTAQSIDTHTMLAGWSRDLGARSHLMFRVGPRFNNGSPAADLSASLTHNWRFSSIAISVLRTQTTAVGYAGAVETQSAQAKFAYAPSRRLTAFATPALIRNTREQLEGTVYRVALGARYAITPMLGFDIAYHLDRQDGAIDPLLADAEFSHATLSVGFTTRWTRER
ncbi:MAG TPA: hypothetical protein VGK04_08220 [Thermoanaerobaculia bacterium]